jgi:hypothetical protein
MVGTFKKTKNNMEIEKIKKAREIFLRENPHPRVREVVDAYPNMGVVDRQILFYTSRIGVKYLMQNNPKYNNTQHYE